MRTETPVTIQLKDYKPTSHVISHVSLEVSLHATRTMTKSTLQVMPRGKSSEPLELDGEGLELLDITIDGALLQLQHFRYENNVLTIENVPAKPFTLTITQACNPESNTALSGLYLSNGVFCTQMEAEGFRRFAFMQDRPDAMATYRVRVEAPVHLPVLLSNGNLVETGGDDDTHFAIWEDPHPKPTYLFALVAGDLASVKDDFETAEGRKVSLGIYVEKGKEDRCDWAMTCLKTSMRWDETQYGRCYDLDVFNIVAVSDFNMGAMENKGLNIFNDKYILARPDTATDVDHVNIERIIAHEYFHNWTGNRITCRDWFQLCLKEGLTVFRDQEFTADLRSRAVKRIEDVKTLRARQFPEDQGPLAHAVRPSSYIEINNFYTPTIYEKGAEICRMLHTLLGAKAFRRATDLYFLRHDGEAATVEDFLRCMADASGRDLTAFSVWYEQAGTPIVDVATRYDEKAQTYHVDLKQHTPATPGQQHKIPLHLPLRFALLDTQGLDMVLPPLAGVQEGVFEFTTERATLSFTQIEQRPVLSINRGFSAPIILRSDASEEDLLFQMACDADSYNRWEAAQICAKRLLVDAYHGKIVSTEKFAAGLLRSLQSNQLDDAFKALLLQLPSEAEITVAIGASVNAQRVHDVRHAVLAEITTILKDELTTTLKSTEQHGEYKPDVIGTSQRSLRSAALALLSHADGDTALRVAQVDFASAASMTVELGALSGVLAVHDAAVDVMLDAFYQRHNGDHLLVDKWFMLKAARARSAEEVETLMGHSAFSMRTPNRVYAVLGAFTGSNLKCFHAADGSGYRMLANCIITLNTINPQVAARMANGLRSWGLYDEACKANARLEMTRILQHAGLSNDVYEIISRTLKA